MPRCCYPNCTRPQVYKPVVEVPTVRVTQHRTEPSRTTRPTYLIAPEICEQHRNGYNFIYWFGQRDWDRMRQEGARLGFAIPESNMIMVKFMPLNWTPNIRYMELDRGH